MLGYKIFRNNGTGKGRGLLIAIKGKLNIIAVEVKGEDSIGQTL